MLEARNLFAFISLPPAAPIMVRECGVIPRDVACYVACLRRMNGVRGSATRNKLRLCELAQAPNHVVANRGSTGYVPRIMVP